MDSHPEMGRPAPEAKPSISSLGSEPAVPCDQEVLGPPRQPGLLGSLGRLDIHERTEAGGMGLVFKARYARRCEEESTAESEPEDPEWLAVKVLRPELAGDVKARHYFENEARHQMQLGHPNILRVLAVGEYNRRPYYVMPWVNGGSLADLLSKRTPLSELRIIDIAIQVAHSLAHAHKQGIIHRDLKPSNVLFDAGGRVLLADFGLARNLFNDPVLRLHTDHCLGTAPYMSPAVAAGEAEDTRCDIYSFGALLYEILAGQPPYTGTSAVEVLRKIVAGPPPPLRERAPDAPPGLVKIAEWAMARVLRNRYADMVDVVADLARVHAGKAPVGPHAASGSWKFLSWDDAKKGVWAALFIGLLVCAGLVSSRNFLEPIRTLHVPGIRNWWRASTGDWNGDGELDLFVVRENQVAQANLEIVALHGEIIDQGIIAPKEAQDVSLDWVRDVDGDDRDELFVSWREGSDAVVSVKNQHFFELKRFEVRGTASSKEPSIGHYGSVIRPILLEDLDGDRSRELVAFVNTGYEEQKQPRAVLCFDFESARLRWRYDTGAWLSHGAVLQAGSEKRLVVTGSATTNGSVGPDGTNDTNAYLYAFSAGGDLIWRRLLGQYVYANLAPARFRWNNEPAVLVWLTADATWKGAGIVGKLQSFRMDGTPIAEYDSQASLTSAAVAKLRSGDEPVVLATDNTGMLHCLDANLKLLKKVLVQPNEKEWVRTILSGAADLNGDGSPEIVLRSAQCELKSERNLGRVTEPPTVIFTHENSIIVLNTNLDRLAKHILAPRWKNFPEFSVTLGDVDHDGRAEILSLADRVVVLKWNGWGL